jgi:hypothetical protein
MAAVRHFWPSADADQARRINERVKKWRQTARPRDERPKRVKGRPARAASSPSVVEAARAAPAPAPRTERATADAALGRVEFLRLQLVQLLQLQDTASTRGDLRAYPAISKRVAEIRAELDTAIELERQVVRLDRTATVICLELERRQKAIAIRAEIERRNRARRGEG